MSNYYELLHKYINLGHRHREMFDSTIQLKSDLIIFDAARVMFTLNEFLFAKEEFIDLLNRPHFLTDSTALIGYNKHLIIVEVDKLVTTNFQEKSICSICQYCIDQAPWYSHVFDNSCICFNPAEVLNLVQPFHIANRVIRAIDYQPIQRDNPNSIIIEHTEDDIDKASNYIDSASSPENSIQVEDGEEENGPLSQIF